VVRRETARLLKVKEVHGKYNLKEMIFEVVTAVSVLYLLE
jgi:hypothetical protein